MSVASSSSRQRELSLVDLTGLCAAVTVARLRALELRPAVEACEAEAPAQHGVVLAQEPAAESVVRRAQQVTLLVGQRPEDHGAGSRSSRQATASVRDAVSAPGLAVAVPSLGKISGPGDSVSDAASPRTQPPEPAARHSQNAVQVAVELPVSAALRLPEPARAEWECEQSGPPAPARSVRRPRAGVTVRDMSASCVFPLDATALDEIVGRLSDPVAARVIDAIRMDGLTPPAGGRRWLDAHDVAEQLGVSREWLHEHTDELGARRIGNEPRPRLRFPAQVLGSPDRGAIFVSAERSRHSREAAH